MGIWEIISGALLILASLCIIIMVMLQEGKGNGLSSVMSGSEMMNEGRARSRDTVLAKYTKIAAIVFFIATFLVSVFSIYLK